jgi:hypothetical protein
MFITQMFRSLSSATVLFTQMFRSLSSATVCYVIITSFSVEAAEVKRPDFSVKRGFFEKPFKLKLKPDPANAVIKYTLDGTAPAPNHGVVYNEPISISKTTFVRAISYIIGLDTTSIRTHTYIFFNDVINQKDNHLADYGQKYVESRETNGVFWSEKFDMSDVGSTTLADIKKCLVDIPSISIVMEKKNLFSAEGIYWASELHKRKTLPASIEMIYPRGYRGDKYNSWQENCGLRIHGGSARIPKGKYRDNKQSFSAIFKEEFGAKKLNHDIFKDAPFNASTASGTYNRIILRAGHNDNYGMNWGKEETRGMDLLYPLRK